MLRSRGTVDLLRHGLLPQEFWDGEGLADRQSGVDTLSGVASRQFSLSPSKDIGTWKDINSGNKRPEKNPTQTNLIGPPDKPRRRMKYLKTVRMMV